MLNSGFMKSLYILFITFLFSLVTFCGGSSDDGGAATEDSGTSSTPTYTLTASIDTTINNKEFSLAVFDSSGNFVAGLWNDQTTDGSGDLSKNVYSVNSNKCVTTSDAALADGTYTVYFLINTDGTSTTFKNNCSTTGGYELNAEQGVRKQVTISGGAQTVSITQAELAATVTQNITFGSTSAGAGSTNGLCGVFDAQKSVQAVNEASQTRDQMAFESGTGLTNGNGTVTGTYKAISGNFYKLHCFVDENSDGQPQSGEPNAVSTANYSGGTTTINSGWSDFP